MSALDAVPQNLNFLSPLGYRFIVKKLPHVDYFLQNVILPGFSIPPVAYPNPFVAIPYSGDHIEYETLRLTFKVDVDLKNYQEIHKWMRGLGFPEDFGEYEELYKQSQQPPILPGRSTISTLGVGMFSDASLIILTNLKNPNIEIVFRDCFPVSIGALDFKTTDSDVINLNCTAEFKYTLFDVSMIPKG